MQEIDITKILAGRKTVDAYRTAHTELHSKPWHKGIPEAHTPLLEKLLVELKALGFGSLTDFSTASTQLNLEELGLTDKVLTKDERISLSEAWR